MVLGGADVGDVVFPCLVGLLVDCGPAVIIIVGDTRVGVADIIGAFDIVVGVSVFLLPLRHAKNLFRYRVPHHYRV